jgi:hypothetical protein
MGLGIVVSFMLCPYLLVGASNIRAIQSRLGDDNKNSAVLRMTLSKLLQDCTHEKNTTACDESQCSYEVYFFFFCMLSIWGNYSYGRPLW